MMLFNNCYKEDNLEKTIAYICNNKYKYFLNKRNVVGIACGYKVQNGLYTNKLCIKVFVVKKLPLSELNSRDLIPNTYHGIFTDVIESGVFKEKLFINKIRPVVGGYGIGNDYALESTGTLGCLVTDGHDNYILSCNHVLANGNLAPLYTKIIQPSHSHGGIFVLDVIAVLSKFVPIKFKTFLTIPANYADCAIGKVINKSLVSSKIALIGPPQGTIFPKLKEEVKKVGAITELTTGRIKDIYGTVKVKLTFCGKTALFKDQIITTSMGECGDSGAVVLDKNNNVVGLFSAGSRSVDIVNPINYILKELNISLITD